LITPGALAEGVMKFRQRGTGFRGFPFKAAGRFAGGRGVFAAGVESPFRVGSPTMSDKVA